MTLHEKDPLSIPDSPRPPDEAAAVLGRWLDAWPAALTAWSKFTRLRPPLLCDSAAAAKAAGLTGSFAMIRLVDQAIVVDLAEVRACGVESFAVEILAHEIGHHVLAPATLTDHARMIARMRVALPTVEKHAAMVANLYTDLLINDRLQRSAGLRMAGVFRALSRTKTAGGVVWALYLRIYELLWRLERGSLGGGPTTDAVEGDAWLGARLVRSYARDWLDGSGRFAALFLPHLLEDEKSAAILAKLLDTARAGAGGEPAGLVEAEAGERDGAIHPAQDPALTDSAADDEAPDAGLSHVPRDVRENTSGGGQARQPFQYGEILRAAGLDLTDHDVAVRYYAERARPYLVPFPTRETPESTEPLPEGLEPWDMGQPLDAVDWFQSVLQSPRIFSGMTTVQRVWGTTEGREPKRMPLDLDLYVDSSGSMPNPQQLTSFPALAGAILCLSALRAGARVQATLWSGAHQFLTTGGFIRDREAILRVLTGYFGGGTAFPIHLLRDTYAQRPPTERPAHILIISDDGVSTLYERDERGLSGRDVAGMALQRAGGGGSLVLNLPEDWDSLSGAFATIREAKDQQGWQVHRVATLEGLVEFARQFSRMRYGSHRRAAAGAARS